MLFGAPRPEVFLKQGSLRTLTTRMPHARRIWRCVLCSFVVHPLGKAGRATFCAWWKQCGHRRQRQI